MQEQTGLLSGFQPAQQQGSGLLGSFGGGQGQNQGLQMAQQLAQNPTPQMAQQIVAQMRQAGMPEADQFEQILGKIGGDPQAIKQIAESVIQSLSGV